MSPNDDLDPLKENEDPSAEVTDIDDALVQAGQGTDTDAGPRPVGEDSDLFTLEPKLDSPPDED